VGTKYEYRPAVSLFDDEPGYEPSPQQHPPYTVLDAAGGWWQQRRAYWSELGHSDAGARPRTFNRGAPEASEASGNVGAVTADSQFSPVLTELLVAWYGGTSIFDPFAGGPTRGFVARAMSRGYLGVELSADQIAANEEAFPDLGVWTLGDATTYEPPKVDCVLTCPPYHDVERYSDHPRDLSNMSWSEFTFAHVEVVRRAAAALNPGGFAVWVVGDFRGRDGALRGFPDLVAMQMDDEGLERWNRHIVRQPLVTAQMRWRQSWKNHKATTTHAEVIVGRKA
jgi:hypothetical protein